MSGRGHLALNGPGHLALSGLGRLALSGLNCLALLCAMVGLGVLGACASPPQGSSTVAPATSRLYSGRIAVRVAASQARPAQSLAADFELRGNAEQGELTLFSPLGTALAQARWQAGTAELWLATHGKRSFANLDDLAEQTLGERVPLAALPDWLAGRPWPLATHNASITGFEQLGWAVDVSQLSQGKLVAQRAAEPAVVLRVTLDGNGA